MNVSRNKEDTALLDPNVIDMIREYNRLDMELYAFSKRLFEDRVATHGPHFQKRLRSYRAVNTLLSPVVRFRDLAARDNQVHAAWGLEVDQYNSK